jgi:hypothetical protein
MSAYVYPVAFSLVLAGPNGALRSHAPAMAEITDQELEVLQNGFDTHFLIRAIDELDKMRGHLNDRRPTIPRKSATTFSSWTIWRWTSSTMA